MLDNSFVRSPSRIGVEQPNQSQQILVADPHVTLYNMTIFPLSIQVTTPAWFASATTSARTTATVAMTTNKFATTEVSGAGRRPHPLRLTDALFSWIGETRGLRGRQ